MEFETTPESDASRQRLCEVSVKELQAERARLRVVVERGIAAQRKLAEIESRLRKADDRNVAQGDAGAVLENGADQPSLFSPAGEDLSKASRSGETTKVATLEKLVAFLLATRGDVVNNFAQSLGFLRRLAQSKKLVMGFRLDLGVVEQAAQIAGVELEAANEGTSGTSADGVAASALPEQGADIVSDVESDQDDRDFISGRTYPAQHGVPSGYMSFFDYRPSLDAIAAAMRLRHYVANHELNLEAWADWHLLRSQPCIKLEGHAMDRLSVTRLSGLRSVHVLDVLHDRTVLGVFETIAHPSLTYILDTPGLCGRVLGQIEYVVHIKRTFEPSVINGANWLYNEFRGLLQSACENPTEFVHVRNFRTKWGSEPEA